MFSVAHVCEHLGQEVTITHDPDIILTASHVIVPGQGAFKQAMTALTDLNLGDVLLLGKFILMGNLLKPTLLRRNLSTAGLGKR